MKITTRQLQSNDDRYNWRGPEPNHPKNREPLTPVPPEERPIQSAPGRRAQKPSEIIPTGQKPKVDPQVAARLAVFRVKHHTDQSYIENSLIGRIHACLPTPHPKQQIIEMSPAKRKVINFGRRAGKTTDAARVAIIKMTEGRRVLLASTTQDQADAFWEKCKLWLDPFIQYGDIIKNETKRTLEFAFTGGRIKVKTASDADMLRGDYADFLVLDECALLAPNAWEEVGAPMLLDNDGDAWFLSTPRRRNWFYGLYQRAKADETGRWEAFHCTSFDNPHLSEDALEEIAADLNDEAYRQEILAEFLEGEGAVFRNITACMTAERNPLYKSHEGHMLVMGIDWALKHDYTAISVFCATCNREVMLDRFNQVDYAIQRERIKSAYKAWNVRYALAEENAMGGPIISALSNEDHLFVEPFQTTMRSKGELIRSLALAFERNEVQFIDYPVATAELEAYEATVSRVTGHISYSAPKGLHDDTVVARALAYKAAVDGVPLQAPVASGYSQSLPMVYNPRDTGVPGSSPHTSASGGGSMVYYGSGSPSFKAYEKFKLPGMR